MKYKINRFWAFCGEKMADLIADPPKSLTIARINTTLIAVFIAGISAYLTFVNTVIRETELKAIEEAGQINNIQFNILYCPYRQIDEDELFNRDKLLDMITNTIIGIDDPSLPKDIKGRAERVLGIMGAFTTQYPFPISVSKTKEGKVQSKKPADDLVFANINEVRNWANVLDKITNPLMMDWVLQPSRLSMLMDEFAKSQYVYDMTNKLTNAFGGIRDEAGYHVFLEALNPIAVYSDYFTKIRNARMIMKSTRRYIMQADAFRERYPSKLILGIAFCLVILAFGYGVIYPLYYSNVRKILVLSLPLSIYVVVFLYLVGKVIF
ncbi:MAG: hypothetical protein ACLQBD_21975 [Syntrophobacteraceae bacterium]